MPSVSARYCSSSRWCLITSTAALRPAVVNFAPRYGSWTTSLSVASFFSIDVTDGGETPSDPASAEVVARPCSDSSRWISLR